MIMPTAEPRTAEPRTAEPRTAEPRRFAENCTEIHGNNEHKGNCNNSRSASLAVELSLQLQLTMKLLLSLLLPLLLPFPRISPLYFCEIRGSVVKLGMA